MDEWKQIEELLELCRSMSVTVGDPDFNHGSVELNKGAYWDVRFVVRRHTVNTSDDSPFRAFRGRGATIQAALDVVKPMVVDAARKMLGKRDIENVSVAKALRAATGE
jgi:hypothetical protein